MSSENQNNSASDQETIGELLKKARTKLNISVEKVAAHTKIREENILAIEDNQTLSHIPHTYYRGYIKCYCAFLGIDTTKAMEKVSIVADETPKIAYSEGSAFHYKWSANKKDHMLSNNKPGSKKARFGILLVLATLIVCAGLTISYSTSYQIPSTMAESNQHSEKLDSIINIT